ncbi:MAG: hypothetical protein ACK569_12255 [Hyphomonadaceae bacterium]
MSLDKQGEDQTTLSGPVVQKSKTQRFLRRPVLTGAAALALGIAAFGAGQILSPSLSTAQHIKT